jgi:hypothetical protein
MQDWRKALAVQRSLYTVSTSYLHMIIAAELWQRSADA